MQEEHRGNAKNLISLADRTEEDRKRIASMGGKACQEAKKRKKELTEQLQICLEMKDKKGRSYKELATLGLIKSAVNGSAHAYRLMAQLLGELEPDKEIDEDDKNGVLNDLLEALNNVKKS